MKTDGGKPLQAFVFVFVFVIELVFVCGALVLAFTLGTIGGQWPPDEDRRGNGWFVFVSVFVFVIIFVFGGTGGLHSGH